MELESLDYFSLRWLVLGSIVLCFGILQWTLGLINRWSSSISYLLRACKERLEKMKIVNYLGVTAQISDLK